MAVTVTAKVLNEPSGADNSQRRTIIQGTFTLSGSYVAGGFTFPWSTLQNVAGENVLIPTIDSYPTWVEAYMSIPATSGPSYAYVVLWNYSTNQFQIYGSPGTSAQGTGLEELAAATLPTDVSGATFAFKAEFLNQD